MRSLQEILAETEITVRRKISNLFNETVDLSIEEFQRELLEEDKKAEEKGAGQDTKGKLHELLVGYHLQGGKHMQKHPDKEGATPKEAHDKLKATVSKEEYHKINARAKSAADDLRSKVEKNGHKVSHVHWTSQPGDIHRSTGIHASQKEDASDIMIHTKHEKSGKVKYHGVSLKVSDGSSKHVPVSNPGMESTHGGHKIVEKHREEIRKKFPSLTKMSVKDRKAKVKSSSRMQSWLKKKNTETLQKLGHHLHKTLSKMSPDDLAHHIKTHVLQSNPTPLQQAGHAHIRHTTYTVKGENKHHSYDPHEHFSHIFKDPKNITHHVKVEHSGGASVQFKYKGKTFASHRLKFNSQSDPFSSVKGSGTTHGD